MKKNAMPAGRQGFAPILIILVIAILGVVGYFGYKNSQHISSPSPNPNTKTATTKEYVTKGNAVEMGFPKLSFSYPPDWMVTEKGNDISITKNGYKVNINQDLVAGAGSCQFKDSPLPNGPSADFTMVEYKETDSGFGHLRYFLSPLNNDNSKNIYVFCMKDGNGYVFPIIGSVGIDTPIILDNTIFTEALIIVKSVKLSQVTSERRDQPTPNGGAYSIIYFQDSDGNPTVKDEAVKAEIVEYSQDGKELVRTYGLVGK